MQLARRCHSPGLFLGTTFAVRASGRVLANSVRRYMCPPIPQLLDLRKLVIAVGRISDANDAEAGDAGGLCERLAER